MGETRTWGVRILIVQKAASPMFHRRSSLFVSLWMMFCGAQSCGLAKVLFHRIPDDFVLLRTDGQVTYHKAVAGIYRKQDGLRDLIGTEHAFRLF